MPKYLRFLPRARPGRHGRRLSASRNRKIQWATPNPKVKIKRVSRTLTQRQKSWFIPDGLEWNGKTEGFFVEWLSYFVLFTDRFSFAITGSHPYFILSTPKLRKSLHTISFEYLLELQSDSLIYKSLQFISFEYLLELQSDSLIYFPWISFRITIGFVNLYRSSTKPKIPSGLTALVGIWL